MTPDDLARSVTAWGPLETPQLIQARENIVFRSVLVDGQPVALRLHRPGYQTPEAVEAELLLSEALASEGFACPQPVRSQTGAVVEFLDDGMTQASVVTWVDGRPLTRVSLEELPTALRYEMVGRLLADFHLAADRVKPDLSPRTSWSASALTENGPWGDPLEDPELTAAEQALLLRARRLAAERLTQVSPAEIGAIHGDPLPDNMLLTESGLVLIDFDDCGHGYRAYDLAIATISLAGNNEYQIASDALAKGYSAAGGPLSSDGLALVPLFAMLRAQASASWSRTRCDAADPRRQSYRQRALLMSECFQ